MRPSWFSAKEFANWFRNLNAESRTATPAVGLTDLRISSMPPP
jgi:hypothetical protein